MKGRTLEGTKTVRLFKNRTKFIALLICFAIVTVFLVSACSKKQDGTESPSAGATRERSSASEEPVMLAKKTILSEGVRSAKFVLETKDGNDVLNVVVLDKVKDSDSIKYDYEWARNGEPAGKGTSVSGFKRGDKMSVKITPVAGETLGRSRTLTTEIKNSTPKIIELKSIAGDEKQLSYQVVAKDADGDALTYSLVDGVKGITIDPKSGMVRYSVDPAAPADITATVKVVDGQGGEVLYPLKVQQQEKPAK
jgi:hypothetical protein